MLRIGIRLLWMPLEWLEFRFECFKSRLNLHSNASNLVRMVRIGILNALIACQMVRICIRMLQPWIWIRMLQILFRWLEFVFECFESLSNGSTPFRMVWICIQMCRILFEWLDFAFECFKSLSNVSNLYSNASSPFRMVRICIRMLQIWFECSEFAFKFLSKRSNLHSNASNPFQMVRIWIQMVRIWIRMFRIPLEWFDSLSNG